MLNLKVAEDKGTCEMANQYDVVASEQSSGSTQLGSGNR